MKTLRSLLSLALAAAVAVSCAPPAPEVDLALVGGHVVDVVRGEVLRDHDVWIVGEEIVSVTPSSEAGTPRAVETVDVTGRYLIPGLVDAHVHLDHVDELELYTAHGITSVFNLRGLPRHLRWAGDVERGERTGPTIYTAGDYVDGYPPFMQPMMSVESVEDAAAAVRLQAEAGYDMIKVYTRLSLDQLRAITAAASEAGLPVVGHSSPNYSLSELIEAGQVNLAHGQDLIRWYLEDADDLEGLAAIVETLRGTPVTVTSNLSFTEGLIRQGEDLDGLLAEPVAASVPPAVLQPFRRENNRYIRGGVDWVPSVKARLETEKKLARGLHEAGVTLLAGTDASTSGVLPGDSLARELVLLVSAGLEPIDALRTATLAPGRFVAERIDAAELFGRIAEGYRADIAVLTGDPLEQITRVEEVVGVVSRGRYLDRASLDQRLEALAAKSARLTPTVIEIENGIKSGDLEASRRAFEAARVGDPEEFLFSQYVPFFIGYGYLYGEDGYSTDPERLAAALTLYRLYAETYPNFHSAHYMLALALEANGQTDAAIESLERAIEIHPFYPDARKKLAELTG